jgi:hypothetical protein
MSKRKEKADDFFNSIDFPSIVDTIKGIYTSDGTMNTLMDFERVLDESDLYAFRNWELGELVDGPEAKRYSVACTFMYPHKLMPDPRGAKRLLAVGCNIKFKKTEIKVPVEIKDPSDYKAGTHFPKMTTREVWLIRIEMPKTIMNDIREGSIDLAGQTIDLSDLDEAYGDDLDKEGNETEEKQQGQDIGMGPMPPAPGGAPMPGAPGGMM